MIEQICGNCEHFIPRGDSAGMCDLCDKACSEEFHCDAFEPKEG